jgi:hypothetical protein
MIVLDHMLTIFFAYLQENVINFWEKNCVKSATNHNFFGPWANELHAHLQKNIIKKIEKKVITKQL